MRASIRIPATLAVSCIIFIVAAILGLVGGTYVSSWLGGIWPTDATSIAYHMNPIHSVDPAFVWAIAALAAAAALSFVLLYVKHIETRPRRVFIYWIAFLFLLPLSGSNFASGDILFDVRAQAILDFLMVLFGTTVAIELSRVAVADTLLKVLQIMVIFLVVGFGVALPALYFILFAVASFGVEMGNLSGGLISIVATVVSTVISFLNYRHLASKTTAA